VTAIVLALVLHAQAPALDRETADGYYCSTDRYFAYETLLHDSPAAHLLHVVSLEGSAGSRPELTVPVPAEPTKRIACAPAAVILQGKAQTATLDVDLRAWSALLRDPGPTVGPFSWRESRLWGSGLPTTSAHQRVWLRRFNDGSRAELEIVRLVSGGGAHCESRAGARLAWFDARGRETGSRGIFLRQFSCRRAGVTAPPAVDECTPQAGREFRRLSGRVAAGKEYERPVGPFRFALDEDGRFGWTIRVLPRRGDRDLTSLLPLHGISSRDVRPPSGAEVASEFWRVHPFTFHPDARRTIVYHEDAISMLVDDLRVEWFGRGKLTVGRHAVARADDGQPRFEWIEFSVCMSWPR
jgi:hypothetical protein